MKSDAMEVDDDHSVPSQLIHRMVIIDEDHLEGVHTKLATHELLMCSLQKLNILSQRYAHVMFMQYPPHPYRYM